MKSLLTLLRFSTALALGSSWIACSTDVPRQSIVIISVDTLRADHLGCYGHARATSPNIDAFAADALLFENASAHAPSTWPSLASLMTGFLPHETLAVGGFELGLVEGVDSLAEILQRHGYETKAVVSNWGLVRERGWSQGFDVFDDVLLDKEQVRQIPERVASRTADRAIELIGEARNGPLLLWIHFQDPHGPYTPPAEHAARFTPAPGEPTGVRPLDLNDTTSGYGGIPSYQHLGEHREFAHYQAQYDGEIRYMDEQFGRVVAALRASGLYDEAFLVFTADHGETMGENDNYFGHGESLDRPLLHIPLVVRDGRSLRGRRSDPVQHMDVVPTLLSVAGIEGDPRLRGRDLRSPGPSRPIVAEHDSYGVPGALDASLVLDGKRLLCTHSGGRKRCQLFDATLDPLGQRDLSSDPRHRSEGLALEAKLDEIIADDRLGIELEHAPEPLSEDEEEALRALGYVD